MNITGWTKVAMTQPNASCPHGLTLHTFPSAGLSLCGRESSGCQSAVFPTIGLSYSQVCGQLIGYQFGTTDGFKGLIRDGYWDGASITYGSSRKHIWTYLAGLDANVTSVYSCPCNTGSTAQAPAVVDQDYYCESGSNGMCCEGFPQAHFPDDPLWDGQQCIGLETSCCTNPNMPWFTKTLDETTNEHIEVGVCSGPPETDEDVPLQLIELFIR